MQCLRIVIILALVLLPSPSIAPRGFDEFQSLIGESSRLSSSDARLPEWNEDPASLLSSPRSFHGDGSAESLRPSTSHSEPSEVAHANPRQPRRAQAPRVPSDRSEDELFTDIPFEDGLHITKFNLPREVREKAFTKFDINKRIYEADQVGGYRSDALRRLLKQANDLTIELNKWSNQQPRFLSKVQALDPIAFKGLQHLQAVEGLARRAEQEGGHYDALRAQVVGAQAAVHAEQALNAYLGSIALVTALEHHTSYHRPSSSTGSSLAYMLAVNLKEHVQRIAIRAISNAKRAFPTLDERFSHAQQGFESIVLNPALYRSERHASTASP